MPRLTYFSPALILALLTALLLCGPVAPDSLAAQAVYHGNQKTLVFHASHCRYYSCKNCVVRFLSQAAALKAGFRPCKLCLG